MHWLESDGCCKAVVIENLVFVVVWRYAVRAGRDFRRVGIPIPLPVYCWVLR
jgi:hypothetical protein